MASCFLVLPFLSAQVVVLKHHILRWSKAGDCLFLSDGICLVIVIFNDLELLTSPFSHSSNAKLESSCIFHGIFSRHVASRRCCKTTAF